MFQISVFEGVFSAMVHINHFSELDEMSLFISVIKIECIISVGMLSLEIQGRAKVLELLQKDAIRREQQVLEDREKREQEKEQAEAMKIEKYVMNLS